MIREDRPSEWSLDEHLSHGKVTVAELISLRGIDHTKPRVCFHFEPLKTNEDEPWNDQASYNRLAKPLFEAMPFKLDVDYIGGTSGIEAWEDVIPSVEWLNNRIPELFKLANEAGLRFEGWSFEPLEPNDFSYICCGPELSVVNANTAEGRAAIDELVQNELTQ